MSHFSHSFQFRIIVILLAAMAMIVQGTWGVDIAHHWAFLIIMVVMMGLAGWQAYSSKKSFSKGDKICHGGFALLLLAVFAGYSWNENGQAIITSSDPIRIAYDRQGQPMALPFEMQLKKFDITYYDDNEHIKQFTSELQIKDLTSPDSTIQTLTTQVNRPAIYKGYRLYQDSYDSINERYSVIKIVKEPLLPVIYIAMLLLAIGVLMQIRVHWIGQEKWIYYAIGGLTLIFAFLSVLRIQFGMLMPALRSWWFVPHLAFYMIAYSLLVISLILLAVNYRPSEVSANLLHLSSATLLLGMLCGSVWAQQSWGDWWSWDPKECWAAVTWLFSLAATHTHRVNTSRKSFRIAMMIICFLAMQITWYGVNFLPSSKYSKHIYNTQVDNNISTLED